MSKKKERETRTKKDVVHALHEYPIPDTERGEYIAQVVGPAGNNLHLIRLPDGEECLCSMPNRFRKNIWIKRNDFLIVWPIDEGDKVKAEIVHVLMKEHVRHLRNRGLWPHEFDDEGGSDDETADQGDGAAASGDGDGALAGAEDPPAGDEHSESSDEDDYSDLMPNMNRMGLGPPSDSAEEDDGLESDDSDES
eukprot:m.190056 g.190056  ORF g.190056 m.190056 type:complete len:194 (-) comp17937_c0_seq1:241-822(-)